MSFDRVRTVQDAAGGIIIQTQRPHVVASNCIRALVEYVARKDGGAATDDANNDTCPNDDD